MAWLAVAGMAVSAVGKVAGGFAANAASKREANLLRDQGQIAQEEAYVESQRRADEVRKFAKTQKLAYLKNGVSLAGSPLLVIDETFQQGQEEVNAIVKSGVSQNRMLRKKAEIVRNEGRAALLGSFFDAGGGLLSSAGSMSSGGKGATK